MIYGLPDDWADGDVGHHAIYTLSPEYVPIAHAARVISELRQDVARLNDEAIGYQQAYKNVVAASHVCVNPVDLIIKAESEGLDSEIEYHAFIWTLVSTGLVNSTGSNQRLVADFSHTFGEGWQEACQQAYADYFHAGASS